MYVHCSNDRDLSLQTDQNFLFKAYLCRRKVVPLYVPTCENLPHNRKRPKHTFHLKRSLVSAVAVSRHACFYGFMPLSEFLSLLMFTPSLSDEVLLSVKPDIVTVRSRMFFTPWVARRSSSLFFWLFLKSIRWRLQCLLTVSFIKEQKRIPHIAQRAPSWKWAFRPPSLPPSHCCNRSVPISTRRASIRAKHDHPP